MRVRFKTLHLGNSWNNMLFTLIEEDFSSLELSLRQDSLILNRWTWDTCSILLLIKHLPSIALIYKLFTLKRLEALKVNSSYGLSKSQASSVTWPLLDLWLYFWEILFKQMQQYPMLHGTPWRETAVRSSRKLGPHPTDCWSLCVSFRASRMDVGCGVG